MNDPIRTMIREAIGPDVHRASGYELAVLHGLQFKPTYQGTVPEAVIARRRRANRAARIARRAHRR